MRLYNISNHCSFAQQVSKIICRQDKWQNSVVILPFYSLKQTISYELKEAVNQQVILLPNFVTFADIPNNLHYFLPLCFDLDISQFNIISPSALKIVLANYFSVQKYSFTGLSAFIRDKQGTDFFDYMVKETGYVLHSHAQSTSLQRLAASIKESNTALFIVIPYSPSNEEMEYIRLFSSYKHAIFFLQSDHKTSPNIFGEKIGQYHKNLISLLPESKYSKLTSYNIVSPTFLRARDEFEAGKIASLIICEALNNNKLKLAIICNNSKLADFIESYLLKWNVEVNNLFIKSLLDTPEFNYFLLLTEFAYNKSIEKFIEIIKHPLYRNSPDKDFENLFLRNKFYQTTCNLKDNLPLSSPIRKDLEDWLLIFAKNDYESINHHHIKAFFNTCRLDATRAKTKSTLNLYFHLIQNKITENFNITPSDYIELLKQIALDFLIKDNKQSTIEICSLSHTHYKSYDTVILFDENFDKVKNNNKEQITDGLLSYQQVSNLLRSNLNFIFIDSIDSQEQSPSSLYSLLKLTYRDSSQIGKYHMWLNAINDIPYKPIDRPKPKPDFEMRPLTYSVSAIEKLIRDPYSYYAEYILNLRKLPELVEFKNEKEFGIFIHGVLDVLSNVKSLNIIEIGEVLKKRALEYFNVKSVSNALQLIWFKRLDAIALCLAKYYRQGYPQNNWLEIQGQIQLDLEQMPVIIKARADLIEEYTQHFKIIDFKTGTIPAKKEVITGLFPQLAIEKYIFETGGFQLKPDNKNVEASFLQLNGKNNILKNQQIELDNENTLQGLSELLITFLKALPYFANTEEDNSGKTSNYNHLRRKQEWFDQI